MFRERLYLLSGSFSSNSSWTIANLNTGHFIEWLGPCHSKCHTNGNMPGGYFTWEPSNVLGCGLGEAVPALPWVPHAGTPQSPNTLFQKGAHPSGVNLTLWPSKPHKPMEREGPHLETHIVLPFLGFLEFQLNNHPKVL